MNGIALLLLTAAVGVEYDWRTLEDGQIEYVLIVEPDFIPSLVEGSEIRSSVPPELESVQRLCIRIAPPANSVAAQRPEAPRSLAATAFRNSRIGLRANTEPTTIVWKAKGQPEESTAVRYGWQPTKDGLQEYFVQIDPKFLRTLSPGDEVYTTLSAEAGRVDTFVVFSNAKQLPRVAGRPAAPLAGAAPNATFPRANPPTPTSTFGAPNPLGAAPLASAPLPNSPPAFGPLNSAPPFASAPTLDRPAPFTSQGAFGGVNDAGSRVNPAGAYDQAPPAPTYGNNFAASNTRPNLNPPNAAPPLPNQNGYTSDGFRGNDLRSADPRDQLQQQDPYRSAPAADPRNDLFPAEAGNFASNPPSNPAYRPANGPLPSTAGNMPNNAPYRPSVGYPQDNTMQPAAYDNRPLQNGQPEVGYRPNSDNQMASLNNSSLRTGVRNDLPAAPAATVPAEKPWWTLVFTAFGLFISIGANLYLGWTAAEFYSRYKLAVERLRSSTSARG